MLYMSTYESIQHAFFHDMHVFKGNIVVCFRYLSGFRILRKIIFFAILVFAIFEFRNCFPQYLKSGKIVFLQYSKSGKIVFGNIRSFDYVTTYLICQFQAANGR
jgi:hypothetical protein